MSATIKILYVDDEAPLLEIAKEFLEVQGRYEVETATSARLALDLVAIKNFDAIVSDYSMPETDGIELLKRLRNQGDRTPFLLFTGKGREDVVIDALNNGADFYLQKGGDPMSQFAELASMIDHVVKRRPPHTRTSCPLAKGLINISDARIRLSWSMLRVSWDC